MEGLKVNGNAWPTAETASHGPYDTSHPPDVTQSDYNLVKMTGPPGAIEQDQLEEDKVKILKYLGDNVYLCGFIPKKTRRPPSRH